MGEPLLNRKGMIRILQIALIPVVCGILGLILLALTYAAVLCLADTKSLMSRIMLAGILVFFLFVFGAILLYYTLPHMESKMPVYTFIFSLGIDVLMVFFYSALLKGSLNTANHIQIYERQAYTDALTQVNNRAAFNLLVDQLPPETHPRLTLIMVDLNNLKLVNDTLGHPAGDKLILLAVGSSYLIIGNEEDDHELQLTVT